MTLLSRGLFLAILALLGGSVVYGVLESFFWPRSLWGAHFLAYLPPATWLAAPAALAAILLIAFWNPPPSEPGPASRRWFHLAPILAAAGALVFFWLLRVRHIFWGDGLPLSINIPQGQAFHPDEPLSIYIHHALYQLGGGHWSGVTAVAMGSILAGTAFVARSVQWFSSRIPQRDVALLAAICLLAQGFTQIFYGYVENYAYLAVALLFFLTWGVDFVEGRVGALRPLMAALVASALHILGALTILPALILVVLGLSEPRRRVNTALAAAAVISLGLVAYQFAAGLYGQETPIARFLGGAQKMLTSISAGSQPGQWSLRTVGDIWSQLVIVGPLSLPLLIGLIILLRGARPRPVALFLGTATLVFSIPIFLIGRWGIGPARDWDIFAAPAIAAALSGVLLVAGRVAPVQARRLLLAIAVASIFHTAPWIALNTSRSRTMARVADLPLGKGRGAMMLGTHFLNAGDLSQSEQWFRKSIAEDSTNLNSQSGLGLSLARQGRYEEAFAPMTAAMELNPGRADLHRDLAALLFMLGRWADAAGEMQSLLLLDPTDHAAWLGLSDCNARLGRTREAAAVLEAAAMRLPDHPQIREGLAAAYEMWIVDCARAGDGECAYEGLRRFHARYPTDPRAIRLSSVLAPP